MSSQTRKTTSRELERDADHPQEFRRAHLPASPRKSRYTPNSALPTLPGDRTFTSAPEHSRLPTPQPSDSKCCRAVLFSLPDIHRPGLLPPLLPPRLASQLPLARSRFLNTDHAGSHHLSRSNTRGPGRRLPEFEEKRGICAVGAEQDEGERQGISGLQRGGLAYRRGGASRGRLGQVRRVRALLDSYKERAE